jgi:YCII-related domain
VTPVSVGQQWVGRPTPEEETMAKFLYLYAGGEMAETPEAQEEQMQAWTAWFGTLGESVVDVGNPFGAGTTVSNGGPSDGGASKLGGYSIINAGSLDEAATKANGCPVLQSGGTVEVYEALAM